MPVLVTGGAGFIGSHLCDALCALGARVTVLDDVSGGDRRNLAHLKSLKFINETVLDARAAQRASRGQELVFHQAARVSVPASIADPRAYFEVNSVGTFNVLEAARTCRVRRLMFAASSSAYGESDVLPKVETMTVLPQSPYAAQKSGAEGMIRAYARSFEMDAVSLRYFNIFGPRQNANSAYAGVIAAFARMLLAGQRPRITGDGKATRDFTFVHNAVHANLLAARHKARLDGEVYNVATAKSITITELAVRMAKLLGREDLKPVYAPARPGDVMHSRASIARIARVLNYKPIVGFVSGLRETVRWYEHSACSAEVEGKV